MLDRLGALAELALNLTEVDENRRARLQIFFVGDLESPRQASDGVVDPAFGSRRHGLIVDLSHLRSIRGFRSFRLWHRQPSEFRGITTALRDSYSIDSWNLTPRESRGVVEPLAVASPGDRGARRAEKLGVEPNLNIPAPIASEHGAKQIAPLGTIFHELSTERRKASMYSERTTFGLALSVLVLWLGLTPSQSVAQSGGLRYSIAVADFKNQSGWRGQFDLGQDLGIVLTDRLQESERFIVIGESSMRALALEEQDLAASGRAAAGAKAPATGHLATAQLLVRGAITHVQHDTASDSGGVDLGGLEVGGKRRKTEINITFYIVDTSTGQVLASRNVVGEASKRNFRFRLRSRNGTESRFGTERDDNLMSALTEAADQAVDWMAERLEKLPWQGSIVRVDGQTVWINRGTREGLREGEVLVVGPLDTIRDPSTGEVLGQIVENEVARLEVTSVEEKLGFCRVVSGDPGAIRSGLPVTFPK